MCKLKEMGMPGGVVWFFTRSVPRLKRSTKLKTKLATKRITRFQLPIYCSFDRAVSRTM
jgi:hypothetical protein